MKYTTVIFDLDGTVLNSLDDLFDSANYALEKNNLPLRTKDEIRSFVGNGARKLIERSVGENGDENVIQKVFDEFISHYKLNCTNKTAPYDGVCEMLEELRKTGVKTAVVSNKADFAVGQLCERYFPSLFDICLGEKEGIKAKPCPDAVFMVMEKLGAKKEETVYVGDSEVDIETAKNASLPCISVDWGFKTKEFLLENGAELVISDVKSLLNELVK